jgi:mono/diheme cytochrome c family protein
MHNVRKTIMIAVLTLAACGDPETNDERGYTKAPLETPTVLVRGEPESVMDGLGNPALPEAPIIKAEEETAKTQTGTAAPQTAGSVPQGATAADVTAGQTVFSATGNCFTCHGQNGAGTALAPALNDNQWLNISGDYASIQQVVNNGVAIPKQFPAAMPAKGGAPLTEQQVRQVSAYVYSISH